MAEAILKMDGVEMRSTNQRTCRTLLRLMTLSISPDDQAQLVDPPIRTDSPEPP